MSCKSQEGLRKSDFNRSLQSRFDSKCAPLNDRGCVSWMGVKTSKGYGLLRAAGAAAPRTTAHRIAWVLYRGDLAPGECVLHKCDNPSCVNPAHLFVGSPKDNTDDMVSKGRHAWKDGTPWQKLRADDIEKIGAMRKAGQTQEKVASFFGVSRSLISLIEHGHVHCSVPA